MKTMVKLRIMGIMMGTGTTKTGWKGYRGDVNWKERNGEDYDNENHEYEDGVEDNDEDKYITGL